MAKRTSVPEVLDHAPDPVLVLYRIELDRRGLSSSTIRTYGYRLRALDQARQSAGGTLLDATAEDIQLFLDHRRLIPRTRYVWLSSLHTFYEWARKAELVDRNPTVDIVRPRPRRTLPRPITEDDLTAAIRQADPQMAAWLTLAAFAGLRCAEIAGLKTEDVMLDDNLLRVLGKGGHERVVPMHPRVRAALIRHGIRRRGYLFVRPEFDELGRHHPAHGARYSAKNVSRLFSAHFRELGLEATAHQLRHRFATRTYQASRDIRVVQELLGHQSPTTTAIYTAFRRTDAIAAVASIPDVEA
jgi:integrase/recombinase XerC